MNKSRIFLWRQMSFTMVVVLITFNISYSQINDCENRMQTELISKIKGIKPTDLVPYYITETKKWGFIHRETKKILVVGIFSNLQTFTPYLKTYFDGFGNCKISLKYSNGEYSFFTPSERPVYPPGPVSALNSTKFVKDIEGFEVNDKGEIVAVKSMFFTPQDTISNLGYSKISKVVQHRGTYYGVVLNKNNSFSIYNDKGKIIDGFENLKSYPNINNGYDDCDDFWVLVDDDAGKYLFKSLTSPDTIQMDCSSPRCWDCAGRNYFGYQILEVNGEIGLFDMLTMQWKIKPAATNRFHSMFYSTTVEMENCKSQKQVKQNRKLATVYLLTFENTIVDLNGNIIEPEQK